MNVTIFKSSDIDSRYSAVRLQVHLKLIQTCKKAILIYIFERIVVAEYMCETNYSDYTTEKLNTSQITLVERYN